MSLHEFEHSWSVKKPSSESYAWSYKQACDACLYEIEKRHGVDWKVTDVTFVDKGRSTQTREDRLGRRTWRCTHTVLAKYEVVHRIGITEMASKEIIEDKLTITYKMININYGIGE